MNTALHVFQVAKNWVSSKEPLDTPVPSRHRYECPQVSAGETKRERDGQGVDNSKQILGFV